METLIGSVPSGTIQGRYDAQFSNLVETFNRNFTVAGEIGASLCVMVEGETVVDVWGGSANEKEAKPWLEDTLVTVFSSTKGATALAAHSLISAGELQLEEFVGHYWPEFAANGKEAATVRMMLDHSVGVPCLRDPVKAGGAHVDTVDAQ